MKCRRIVITALAATLAVAGLAGCRTNVGVAARVQGTTISESDVNAYLNPKGVASDVAAQGQAEPPRSLILELLIREQVFEKTLHRLNIPVNEGALAAEHDEAGSALLQTQLSGSAVDRQVEKELVSLGVNRSFRSRILRVQEMEYLLVRRKNMSQQSQLAAAVKPAATKVTVSARYGRWDAQSMSLSSDPVLPSFVVPAGSGT